MKWYEKWQSAYEQAAFYKSKQNTSNYWNSVAMSNSDGLSGNGHIEILGNYLLEKDILDANHTMLDIGCGTGNYTLYFMNKCKSITAMDYSEDMLRICESRCKEAKASNVTYMLEDINDYYPEKQYDYILACLNPTTYIPHIFIKSLAMANRYMIYFSMDIPIDSDGNESIYCGVNSVRFPEKYLKENGISYAKVPYQYEIILEDGSVKKIPFAYLIIESNMRMIDIH